MISFNCTKFQPNSLSSLSEGRSSSLYRAGDYEKISSLIHTVKPTNALVLQLHFSTQFVIPPTCFDLSWSSSGNYLTSI